MAKVGAQRAAELTGKSKSTIQRAMNAGKLSYEIDANGRRLVDVSELERVFGLEPQSNDNAPRGASESASPAFAVELELEKARNAIEVERLRMEARMAQEQLEMAQRQIEDLKVQRDLWQKQAQQILITSQYSQKQSEERIAEMQAREEARQRAMEAKKTQNGVVNHSARPAAQAQSAQRPQPQFVQNPAQGSVQPAQQSQQGPVFRTVQSGNQNRLPAPAQKTSLFASLFGTKKAR
ncbi:MAG: entry exclusion 1 domain-containing protein [Proteobacteria bacterium]|nr:entry exclusion 1 domain-containing protein [Pseudomonadota bacterium]